jgi:thymidylate synthase (FAD)
MQIVEPKYEFTSPIDGAQMLKHIERVARTCYKSEDKISDDLSSAKKMIANLVRLGHHAMIEHCSFSAKFTCDVGFYKDLTRHRLASFAIESTRWINYSGDKFGSELAFIRPVNIAEGTPEYALWLETMQKIEDNYMAMAKLGCKPDQLRMLLPHSTKAEVNLTANLREWRHIFELRALGHAHPSIKQLLRPMLREVAAKIPVIFDDLAARLDEEDAAAGNA